MQRRTHELDGGGGKKLGDALCVEVFFQGQRHGGVQGGGEEGRQVEGGEDGEAVAEGEEEEGGRGYGAGGCAEELGQLLVFVEAEGEVCGRGGEEFRGP